MTASSNARQAATASLAGSNLDLEALPLLALGHGIDIQLPWALGSGPGQHAVERSAIEVATVCYYRADHCRVRDIV